MGGSIQKNLTLTGTVTTFAGSAGTSGTTDGTGTAALFNKPFGLTTDGTNLYVADSVNRVIRKVVISTGVATTLAGSAGVMGSTDGTGTAALFAYPTGITTDGTHLYVADATGSTIRKIVIATGVVTTLAGSAGVSGTTDGTGTAALFNKPYGITTDGTNLYVADVITVGSISSSSTIRKVVIATGVVTTIADGTGTAALFNYPSGITTDGTNLYVADTYNYRIRKVVIATGVVTTIYNSVGSPNGITTDGTNLYVTMGGLGYTIEKVVIATGVITTLAGSSTALTGSTDGTGTAALFNQPHGITTDGTSLYVADTYNSAIRKIQ